MGSEILTVPKIDRTISEAKADGQDKKIADGHGLYLFVRPNGSAAWRHKFNFGTKVSEGKNTKGKVVPHEWLDTLGSYPETSIKDARARHQKNRIDLDAGINPIAKKRKAKSVGTAFAQVADNYINLRMVKKGRAARTIDKARGQLRRYINPKIGDKPIQEITDTDLLEILKHIELLGKIETAYKTKELLARIFRYAKAQKLCTHNIVADIERDALPDRPENHLAAIFERPKVGQLLRAIEGYRGQTATQAALRLLPHVFLRSTEFRCAHWSEIDFKAAQWRVPAVRMKPSGKERKREEHIVPLSRQALAILKQLHESPGRGEHVFPAIGPKKRAISENTLGAALRTLGYDSETQTPHGFRAIFRTIAAEDLEIRIDWLELQLAHEIKDANGKAYNRASFLPQRAKVMQQWSDHLDRLRDGGSVVSITSKRRAS